MGAGEKLKDILGIEGKTWEVLKPMIGYNSASITLGGAPYPLNLYHSQYLAYVEGLQTGTVGNISGINGVTDAFTDVAMGVITDRTRSKYGRHRRYFLWGALPFAISYFMRWTSFGISAGGSTTHIFIYYLCAALLYSTSYTMLSIPHTAMLPQVAPKYFLRTQFKTVQYLMNSVGQISSFLLMAIALGGTNMPNPSPADRQKYMILGTILSIWYLWPPIACFFLTKEPSSLDMVNEPLNIRYVVHQYTQVFSNKAFRQYFFMGLYYMVSRSFYTLSHAYFLTSVADKYNRFNVFNIISGAAEFSGSPVNYLLTKKYGKQACGKITGPLMIIGLLINTFVGPQSSFVILVIASVLYNFGFSGPGFVIENIQPDVTDVDELITGQRREGLISTSNSFFKKTVNSVMNAVVGNMLQHIFAYDTQKSAPADQSARSILGLRLNFCVFPAIFASLTLLMIYRYRMTKADHELIKTIIAEKHEKGSVHISEKDKLRIENITGREWDDMWIGSQITVTS